MVLMTAQQPKLSSLSTHLQHKSRFTDDLFEEKNKFSNNISKLWGDQGKRIGSRALLAKSFVVLALRYYKIQLLHIFQTICYYFNNEDILPFPHSTFFSPDNTTELKSCNIYQQSPTFTIGASEQVRNNLKPRPRRTDRPMAALEASSFPLFMKFGCIQIQKNAVLMTFL